MQNEAEILACFDRALNSPMPLESRLLFCQRKVEFLEDFGSDINMWVFWGLFVFFFLGTFFKGLVMRWKIDAVICLLFHPSRLVAAYEENQKLQKESENSKRKAENGYDRCLAHIIFTTFQVTLQSATIQPMCQRDFTNMNLIISSSQEPDAKRQRVDDGSAVATNAMTDAQANNSAYNYNWYQVGFSSALLHAVSCANMNSHLQYWGVTTSQNSF